jgi:N6-adenosine-specific RNA methylase IME4
MIKTVSLSDVQTKDTLQPRATVNFVIVSEYAEAMKDGQIFPPLDVVWDGEIYWLWDGYHRKEAIKQIGLSEINVKVAEGTLQDAEWLALGANTKHGFHRSNEDKRRAVELALRHPKMKDESLSFLSKHCGVSIGFAHKMYSSFHGEKMNSQVTRNGTTYTQDTTNIGKKKKITKSSPTINLSPQATSQLPFTDLDQNQAEINKLAKLPEETQAEVVSMIADGEAETVTKAKQKIARAKVPELANTPPIPEGKYRCIVIDPPWPIKKIEREERPNQGIELDYPVMTLDEIKALPIADLAASDGCHLYLWVTQKYLPFGLELIREWGFKYQCLMTWRKNVGITPFSWMYDTEHVIFARCGNLPLNQFGLRLSFDAKVNGHSVKPDTFFDDRVVLASPGPRLEMFARKERAGFVVWGDEVNG